MNQLTTSSGYTPVCVYLSKLRPEGGFQNFQVGRITYSWGPSEKYWVEIKGLFHRSQDEISFSGGRPLKGFRYLKDAKMYITKELNDMLDRTALDVEFCRGNPPYKLLYHRKSFD